MEHVIYQGRTSLIKYWFWVGLGGFLVLAGLQLINSPGTQGAGYYFALPGLFLVAIAYLNVRATSYTITSRRVVQRRGILSPRTSEIEIAGIRNVQVNQNSTERLFGIGDVAVSRASRPGTEIVFSGIRSPQQVAKMIPRR